MASALVRGVTIISFPGSSPNTSSPCPNSRPQSQPDPDCTHQTTGPSSPGWYCLFPSRVINPDRPSAWRLAIALARNMCAAGISPYPAGRTSCTPPCVSPLSGKRRSISATPNGTARARSRSSDLRPDRTSPTDISYRVSIERIRCRKSSRSPSRGCTRLPDRKTTRRSENRTGCCNEEVGTS